MFIQQIEEMKPVNLFLGAGVSKLAPSYAPIWKEIQIGFCEGLFDKMRSERWDVDDTDQELEELRRFNFRPETFWERVLNITSLEFISSALSVVNRGKPNLNHKVIAELCDRGIVNNIITTNFDEYLDTCLPNKYHRIVSQDECSTAGSKQIYFKIHGSISSSESLQFTLRHTKKIPDGKSALLERCLQGLPLVFIGYSGWDDDIMPRLRAIAPQIPKIIVVRYPGSRMDEPINLLSQFPQTEIIEADFSRETKVWADSHENELGHRFADRFSSSDEATDLKSFYRQILVKVEVPAIPYLMSLLFELAACRDLSKKYAWLADDACDDARYQDRLSGGLRRRIKVNLSTAVAPSDTEMSKLFMDQAHENISDNPVSIASGTMNNVDRVFEYFYGGKLTSAQEAEIEQYATGALNMLGIGVIHGQGIKFRGSWCMGRLRAYQDHLPEAVQFYTAALADLPEDLDDVQRASFILDFGLAAFRCSAIDNDNEMLNVAIGLLSEAERIAVNINDHMTAAKAMMNLASCYTLCGEFDLSIKKVKRAQELAVLTGDSGLRERAHNLEDSLRMQIQEFKAMM